MPHGLNRTIAFILIAVALVVWAPQASAGLTMYVDHANCPGPGNGSSLNPYCRIQDAICFLNVSGGGGTVLVRPGIYTESIRLFAGISVISTDGPEVTTIDAIDRPCVKSDCTLDIGTKCSAVQIRAVSGVGATPADRLEGFFITGGTGTLNSFPDGTEFVVGGGILIRSSSPTITNNIIVDNVISAGTAKLFYGGGIYVQGASSSALAAPVISTNYIQGNVLDPPDGSYADPARAFGGGIYVGYYSAPTIEDNKLDLNRVGSSLKLNQRAAGAGIAIYSAVSPAVISRNEISGNLSSVRGGGIGLGSIFDGASSTFLPSLATIDSNLFSGNSAGFGGAIHAGTTRARVRSNTFYDNFASAAGGAFYLDASANPTDQALLVNNIVTFNVAYNNTTQAEGGGVFVQNSNPTVKFNDLFGNDPTNVAGTKTDASYVGLNGNVKVDPQFESVVDPVSVRLAATSPLIDVGDNTEAPPADLEGLPRVLDGNGDSVARIDMGAYELQDTDHDGVRDAADNCPSVSNATQTNIDGDTLGDACDNCPITTNEDQADGDGDGDGNVCDNCPTVSNADQSDPDTDGVGTSCDNCPTVSNADQINSDTDSLGDACDTDDDDDGRLDGSDNCRTIPNPTQTDGDTDTVGDACDNCVSTSNASQVNADGDSRGDACDNCISVANSSQQNSDADAFGDACDNCDFLSNPGQQDADTDGVGDLCDSCPADPSNDPDSDGLCGLVDNCDLVANPGQQDSDGDQAGDACDNCLTLPNASQANGDGDALGDACDSCALDTQNDQDGDGICAGDAFAAPKVGKNDNCPAVSNVSQVNADNDALGDSCDSCTLDPLNDQDNDNICVGNAFSSPKTGKNDNCPSVANTLQSNADGDADGDACDLCPLDPLNDADIDGWCANDDNCPTLANATQLDGDDDGKGDLCDNCPSDLNPGQQNADGDALGDACDPCSLDAANDADADGLCANVDNCPSISNPDQRQTDADTFGDACDNCPTVVNGSQADSDADGIGDACRYSSVDGSFFISAIEVTNTEYAQFLNAVAAADTNGLFNSLMGSDARGGITRSGSSGSYTFNVRTNMDRKPVNFVSWLDAARYANWLHNLRPIGAQGTTTTETGAYNLTVANPGTAATRTAGATWFLPTDANWTRAAYHDVFQGVDWSYPTRSNSAPVLAAATSIGGVSNPGNNVANYNLGADWSAQNGHVTSVTACGRASVGPYGTYDQGGNVSEWTETLSSTSRIVRGGSWSDTFARLQSSGAELKAPATEDNKTGFRVARAATCPDTDSDGIDNCIDNCPLASNASQADSDGDGRGNSCDNCPSVSNASQSDTDTDGFGNACDLCPTDATNDVDGDGVCGNVDNCRTVSNPTQADGDTDSVGDACDNCSTVLNPGQENIDGDPKGDVCDNCPTVANPSQSDFKGNGIGDACRHVPIDSSFFISTTEVTNSEYVVFLNAVAKTDTNSLYNSGMSSDARGGITQSGASGNFAYAIKSNMGNKPVVYVSYNDSVRYCNWLHNGRPTGAQGAATTENGAYDLALGDNVVRIAGARWYLPTSTEWARAAYHDVPNGTDWTYPTRSTDAPVEATASSSGNISNPGVNVANYNSGADWNSQNGNLTSVGSAGIRSTSAYGTHDQGGNVAEWTEGPVGANRIYRGGAWSSAVANLASSSSPTQARGTGNNTTGMRIAHVFSCPDVDGDGEADCLDNCPTLANADQADTDADGRGNLCDNCASVANASQTDSDGDTLGDSCDTCSLDPLNDQDGDGICVGNAHIAPKVGRNDNCPTTANASQTNGDADALGDACDSCSLDAQNDQDADGICAGDAFTAPKTGKNDNCSTVANASQTNSDADALGDACDSCTLDPQNDQDADGICAGDAFSAPKVGKNDNCATVANASQTNSDTDPFGDACDSCALDSLNDQDNDGFCVGDAFSAPKTGKNDNCPTTANSSQVNSDADALGDACDSCSLDAQNDQDADGICAGDAFTAPKTGKNDNCPTTANSSQVNSDGDALGDACDSCSLDAQDDQDADGICAGDAFTAPKTGKNDNCPTTANASQTNSDSDALGDACDNCPAVANASQTNADADALGDDCDSCRLDPQNDQDADGICVGDAFSAPKIGKNDNCPTTANTPQTNSDADPLGDACDSCALDSLNDQDTDGICVGDAFSAPKTGKNDNCPTTANASQTNGDADALGDACDSCALDAQDDQDADGICAGDAFTAPKTGKNDNCPTTANASQVNSDADSLGDACDNCPTVANATQTNSDGDTPGDACDNCPTVSNTPQTNSDGDALGDACDSCSLDTQNDQDADGICVGNAFSAPKTGGNDNCATVANTPQTNSDADPLGDACDSCALDTLNDQDSDGICVGNAFLAPKTGGNDNCATVANTPQTNSDADPLGDACDSCALDTLNDQDSDGICVGNAFSAPKTGGNDNCATVANTPQTNADADALGDACDSCSLDPQNDQDGDGICVDAAFSAPKTGGNDNCPSVANPSQTNADADALGDACDSCSLDPQNDQDADGICVGAAFSAPKTGGNDNCPTVANTPQTNADADALGDACDSCSLDPQNDQDADGICVGNAFSAPKTGGNDNCPTTANTPQTNADADALGDACDSCSLDPQNDQDADGICVGNAFSAPKTGGNDNCATVANTPQTNSDADALGDACDSCALDTLNDQDSDGICVGNAFSAPKTGGNDNCATVANTPQTNADADALGDACDSCSLDPQNDQDADGICVGAAFSAPKTGGNDNCPSVANPSQTNADADALGDACDSCSLDPQNDQDADGICVGAAFSAPKTGGNDNCPTTANTPQTNADADVLGDACDSCSLDPQNDQDADGICVGNAFSAPKTGGNDNCATVANTPQTNADADALGDACDSCALDVQNDQDSDGICVGDAFTAPKVGKNDNCALIPNASQVNSDADALGDACDSCALDTLNDQDSDAICAGNSFGTPKIGKNDNCPTVANTSQANVDADTFGDACDNCPAGGLGTDPDQDNLCTYVPDTLILIDNCPDHANPGQEDADGDGRGDACDDCLRGSAGDSDEDNVCTPDDNCPTVANFDQGNLDGDARGNSCDPCPLDALDDSDGDGACANLDNCAVLANPGQANADGDSLGDACDSCPNDAFNDADGDSRCANVDNCPTLANPGQADGDLDSVGDACDSCPADPVNDADGDSVCGNVDNCPAIPNFNQVNADGDPAGDACDACSGDSLDDTDGDGICAGVGFRTPKTADRDNCPSASNVAQTDTDSDGQGNACDTCPLDPVNDGDQDGVCGDVDNCATVANLAQLDGDADGFGDPCDPCPTDATNDRDSDGLCGIVDNCPVNANPGQADADLDGKGDACDACPIDATNDGDADGVCGNIDNCPAVANPAQADGDGDGRGDPCDPCPKDALEDIDQDGRCADIDNCPTVANAGQSDVDLDGLGDVCDACPSDKKNDQDLDGACANADNCPSVTNPTQSDGDGDGVGDACDPCPTDAAKDRDRDGVCPSVDNCPIIANVLQQDVDSDGVGDACDFCDGGDEVDPDRDGVCTFVAGTLTFIDNCPETANPDQIDGDGDGRGDGCDDCLRGSALDIDADNVCGAQDNCPTISNFDQANLDGDALGNSCDPCPQDVLNDADADGACANADNCPTLANASQSNLDGDAFGDACDTCPNDFRDDQDGDGRCADIDNCPTIANAAQTDTDLDNIGNPCDTCPADPANDADHDTVCGNLDNCPAVSNLNQANADGDLAGDICDPCAGDPGDDADGDEICTGIGFRAPKTADRDNCPSTANASQLDSDADGRGNACDICPLDYLDDGDQDGFCANQDNCPGVGNPGQADADSDGSGDACDVCPSDAANDRDSDGLCGGADNCPVNANPGQADSDLDGIGDACDTCPSDTSNDADGDGVCGNVDNCPAAANSSQVDGDTDGLGDPCDPCPKDSLNDIDLDGRCADVDNCPTLANPSQSNLDADARGDACDICPSDRFDDADNDGFCANLDNCPAVANASQADADGDRVGDACDPCPTDPTKDRDHDGVCQGVDNCPSVANPAQTNSDTDSLGDACDPCPFDPLNQC